MLLVYFETFGCQMNVADSDELANALAQQGYATTTNPDNAHLVIINTCSVRERAEMRARARIRELANRKRKHGLDQDLWVIGCMAQRLGDTLQADIPGINRVIGAREIETLQEHVEQFLRRKENGLTHSRTAASPTAFVPVMRGCDNYCTYCIVPYVRGHEYSISVSAIEETVRKLIDTGVKEVTLLGQNVNSYRDPAGCGAFPALLEKLCTVDGLERIRFTTSHPKDCSPELISALASLPKLCSHLHLPIQSGSNRILDAMNRRYTREHYLGLVESLRGAIPDIDLTTDVMVGFPGEEPADFELTLSLFEQVRFTNAFMFAYSPRPGTRSADMPNAVDTAESKRRLARLIELQTEVTREAYQSMQGKTVEVLFTQRQEKRNREWIGQTKGAMRAVLACEDNLAGAILKLVVADATGQTLVCERN